MYLSSSSVILGFLSSGSSGFVIASLRPRKTQEIGVKILQTKERGPEKDNKALSAFSLAVLFGSTSPNIRTRTVIIMVERSAPYSGISFKNKAVAIEVEAILTILLPTRIEESVLSKFSISDKERFARLSPSSA